MYYSVAITSPPYSTLTYACPDYLASAIIKIGMRVVVPLGRGTLRVGIILDEGTEKSGLKEHIKIRSIVWTLERKSIFSIEYLEMISQLSLRQCITMGRIFGHVLPLGLRIIKHKLRYLVADKVKLCSFNELKSLDDAKLRELAKVFIAEKAEMVADSHDKYAGEICTLSCEPPWKVRPSAKMQINILEYLLEHGSASIRNLKKNLGGNIVSIIQKLVEYGHISISSTLISQDFIEQEATANIGFEPELDFELTEAQLTALQSLKLSLGGDKAAIEILFGITGSGKTAVYIELVKECLNCNKSTMLLAPEVALASKLKRDMAKALPDVCVHFFHGYQSVQMREYTFKLLSQNKKPCVIIGTRSALFLPVSNLGLIILDEEHDASFKQDENFHYHAKDIAWYRIKQNKGLLVLGSATPDIKTFYAAKNGQLSLLRLPQRVGGGNLPEVEFVDISGIKSSDSILAPQSQLALKEIIKNNEQAIILLNRRGYAPLMYCLSCNKVAKCPNCEIGLTYHKAHERLVCHYCGHSQPFPCLCSSCQGMHFLPMGEGTEKLVETLTSLLSSEVKILRLDRDSTRVQGKMEEILESFANQEAQILVGTQMVSKGHHFPNVTLALIIDADLGLNMPDYRATERTFQLLVQAAGRAGRAHKKGRVIIQTRDVNHYCWKYVKEADYEGFYENEIVRRQKRKYPPFIKLALIRISYALDYREGAEIVNSLGMMAKSMAKELNITLLGPVPAPLAILNGKRRIYCLLKSDEWIKIRKIYSAIYREFYSNKLKIILDLNPTNML